MLRAGLFWMIWGTHMYTSGVLGPDQDVAREVSSPVSCLCHHGEATEPWLEVEETVVSSTSKGGWDLAFLCPFC